MAVFYLDPSYQTCIILAKGETIVNLDNKSRLQSAFLGGSGLFWNFLCEVTRGSIFIVRPLADVVVKKNIFFIWTQDSHSAAVKVFLYHSATKQQHFFIPILDQKSINNSAILDLFHGNQH